jgi:hypothetical protein
MPTFRAYCIDNSGKYCAEFEAADAGEAMEIVRVSSEELCFKVWARARFVGRVDNGRRFENASHLVPEQYKSAAE